MTSPPKTTQNQLAKPKAVVLLSGGLDSYTTAALACAQGFTCYALTVHYGQRHQQEIACARRLAQKLALAQHQLLRLDLSAFAGSALTSDIEVPKALPHAAVDETAIPVTYVPARNTILLSLALGWAETIGAYDIFIGANAVDYSGYPDCRPAFIHAFERLANLATSAAVEGRGQFRIHAPLIEMTKADIIKRGRQLGLDYALTHSCYDPDQHGRPCGRCDSCRLRRKGFTDAGLKDPLQYPDESGHAD